jgi:peptide/nickel transport system permease protein
MLTYLVRRFLIGLLTLLLITFVIYGLIRSMPGTPMTAELGEDASRKVSLEDFERMREAYGLNDGIPLGYWKWLQTLSTFSLDKSLSRKQPVSKIIGERIGPTLLLSVTSISLAYLLAIPMGLFSAAKGGTWTERGMSTGLYMLYSLPEFVAALFLQIAFCVKLEWFPLTGMVSDNYEDLSYFGRVWDVFQHAFLPVVVLAYAGLAYYSRFVNSNMQEVMRQDYIRTARAKGVSPFQVITVHAFRNTLIPLVTLMGLTFPVLFSGSVIIEQVFTWPGIGRLFLESLRERDYPTIMGLTLLFSVMTLVGQLLADILYSVVDPRITYS